MRRIKIKKNKRTHEKKIRTKKIDTLYIIIREKQKTKQKREKKTTGKDKKSTAWRKKTTTVKIKTTAIKKNKKGKTKKHSTD